MLIYICCIFLEIYLLHSQQFGDTVLLHRYAVEDIRLFHCTSSVRNEYELCGISEVFQILSVPADVYLIKCRIYLVKYAER